MKKEIINADDITCNKFQELISDSKNGKLTKSNRAEIKRYVILSEKIVLYTFSD